MNNLIQHAGKAMVGKTDGKDLLLSLVMVMIVLLLISFVGQYLWNTVLVSLVSGVKPAKSVWQILGLYFLIALLFSH